MIYTYLPYSSFSSILVFHDHTFCCLLQRKRFNRHTFRTYHNLTNMKTILNVSTLPVPTFLFVLSSFGGFFFLPSEPCRARDNPLRSRSSQWLTYIANLGLVTDDTLDEVRLRCNISNATMKTGIGFKSAQFD